MGSSNSRATVKLPAKPESEPVPEPWTPTVGGKQPQLNSDSKLNAFFQSFRVTSSMLTNQNTETTAFQCCWDNKTEIPREMMHIILSFIPPPDLYPFRFVNRSFHVLVEHLMEQWVRNRDEKLVSQLGEEAAKRELFTSFDLDSGLYSDVFVSWSDLARSRYLYEQLVPSCCTRESLVALESSRLHRSEFPRVKVTMLGDIRSGKSMFCCPVILGREYDNLATIGANYCSASFAMGSEENRIKLDMGYGWSSTGSREWLQRLHTQYYSTNLKCVAIGTWKDKKKDNRTSYDVISYCVRNQIPYYECDLRLHEQMLRVLYAIMYYGHFQ